MMLSLLPGQMRSRIMRARMARAKTAEAEMDVAVAWFIASARHMRRRRLFSSLSGNVHRKATAARLMREATERLCETAMDLEDEMDGDGDG
jgi:hypothetical protein